MAAPLYYLEKVNGFLSTSLIFFGFLLLTLFLPILMIVIGIQNLDNCPFDYLIPIWLIIGAGLLFLHHGLNAILALIAFIQKKKGSWNVKQVLHTYCRFDIYSRTVVHILIVGWLIGSSILVFPHASEVSNNPTKLNSYCKSLCFHLLYVMTIILWVYSGISLLATFVLLFLGICRPKV